MGLSQLRASQEDSHELFHPGGLYWHCWCSADQQVSQAVWTRAGGWCRPTGREGIVWPSLCVALLGFLLSLVRLVLWEKDGHGGSALGCSVACRCDGLPVPALPARAAGASFCRKPPICWAAMSHRFCGGDDVYVLHNACFPHSISVFPWVITEDGADGPVLPL